MLRTIGVLSCILALAASPVLAKNQKNHDIRNPGVKLKQTFGVEPTDIMNTPTGVVIDSDQNVYVAETAGSFINKYDLDGNLIATIGKRGNKPGQLNAPMEMEIFNGVLYVGEVGGRRISRFTLDGEFIDTVGEGELVGPRAVAVDGAGTMYALDEFSNRVVTFDSAGNKIAECRPAAFFFPNDIDYDNGYLYVANASAHNILKMDTDCNVIAYTGSLGFDPGQMYYPRGILVKNGLVYVNDVINNRVQVYDTDFNFQYLFGDYTVFSGPMSMAVTAAGDFIVVDTGNYQVKLFSPDNLALPYDIWGQQRTAEGMFNSPAGILYDKKAGEVYITDIGNSRVQVFDFRTGEFKRSFGQFGFGLVPGDIYGARAITMVNELLYVTTSLHQIVVFNKQGEEVDRIGEYGFGPGQFYYPYEVQADSKGNFFVSDNFNNRVQKFDSEWNYISTIGGFGFTEGLLYMPARMYIDKKDRLFVNDTFNNRVQVFDTETGEFISLFGGYGQDEGQLFLPYALTMDPNEKYIIVVEAGNNRISVFNNDENFTFHRFFSSIGATDTDVFFPSGITPCGGRWDFCVTNRMQNTAKRFQLKIKGKVPEVKDPLTPWF